VFSLLLAIVDDVLPVQQDWMIKMGDKPTPRGPTNHCYNPFWKDGRPADYAVATFFGIEKSPYWQEKYPTLFEGTYNCVLSPTCHNWDSTSKIILDGEPTSLASIWDDNGTIKIWLITDVFPWYAFSNNVGALPQQVFENLSDPRLGPYCLGWCSVEWFFDGDAPPLSWAAASAAGVPASEGYLAEQGYSGLDDNHYRYCARHNKTNVKIIMGAAE